MINEDEYLNMLLKTVPMNVNKIKGELKNELSEIRKNLIRKSRIATLFDFFMRKPLQKKSKQLSSTQKKRKKHDVLLPQKNFKNLFQPNELHAHIWLTSLAQNSSFLINYFYHKPSLFVQLLIDNAKHPSYDYLISCILPSLFGYFASSEQIDYAYCFYMILIDNAQPNIVIPILRPFLCSHVTFRYIENVFTNFFHTFFETDISIEKYNSFKNSKQQNNSDILSCAGEKEKKCANDFLLCLEEALPLLPEHVLQLFRQISLKKWGKTKCSNLFFNNFIIPTLILWFKSRFCQKRMREIKFILSIVHENRKGVSNLLSKLFSRSSKNGIRAPCIFQNFGFPSIQYLLCINDICILLKMLKNNNMLPSFIDLSYFKGVPKELIHSLYWCLIYPNKDSYVHISGRLAFPEYKFDKIDNKKNINLFDAMRSKSNKDNPIESIKFLLKHSINDEFQQFLKNYCLDILQDMADSFESLIEFIFMKKQILEWLDIIQTYINKLTLGNIKAIRLEKEVFVKLPFEIKHLGILDSIDKKLFQSYINEIIEVGKHYDFVVHNSKLFSANKVSSHKTIPSIFFKILGLVSNISKFELPERYRILLYATNQINLFSSDESEKDNLFYLFMQNIPGSIILPFYIETNIFLIHETDLVDDYFDTERNSWMKIEKHILKCAMVDEALIRKITDIQDRFSSSYLKWKASNMESPKHSGHSK